MLLMPSAPVGKSTSGIRHHHHPGPPQLTPLPGWVLAVFALVLIHLAQPLVWGPPRVPLWSPASGLGVVLVAWFGWRFAAGVLTASGFLVLAQHLVRVFFFDGVPLLDLSWILLETTLRPLEAVSAWWLYHSAARGSLRMGDPRSAIRFVLLVPGVCALASGEASLGPTKLIASSG